MAVSTTNAYDGPFSANGVTQSFPFTFTAQSAGDVAVLLDNQPITTGYSVELYEGGGGTVTFILCREMTIGSENSRTCPEAVPAINSTANSESHRVIGSL